jgi:antitoxin (DNA-binding transcriptional repressor) of toxin-antitoxin stability system
MMRTIPAAEFKEHCLALLDQVDEEGIIITVGGRQVARLVAMRNPAFDELSGKYRDRIQITGDIMSTGLEWDAQS